MHIYNNNEDIVGGSAFPHAVPDQHGSDGEAISEGWAECGMTLRDYFAGLALQGKFAHGDSTDLFSETASACYQMADAMLKERTKKPTTKK